VDVDAALEFIRHNHHGVLATLRRDGTPQLSPIDAGVDAAGRIVISTREPAMKARNLRRDPRAWLCVFPDSFYPRDGRSHVQVDADAEVVSLPEAMEGLVDYYRGISGEHPDWDDYRAAMARDRRCLIRLVVTRAGPDAAG